MQLLHAVDVTEARVRRTLRHGWLAPVVMAGFFLAPLAFVLVQRRECTAFLRDLPWFVVLAGAPVVLVFALLWLVATMAVLDLVGSTFRTTNWIARTTDEGVYLNLRSYQNRRFPDDGPTVAFLAFAEIAGARAVTETFARECGDDRSKYGLRWVELALRGVDTTELAARVERERTRPAPERRFLGVRWRSRSGHVPVMVPAPGVLRVERTSRALLAELGRHVTVEGARTVDLDRTDERDLEQRVRDFLARGQRIAAIELVAREQRLSIAAARARVEELERPAAA